MHVLIEILATISALSSVNYLEIVNACSRAGMNFSLEICENPM